MKTVIGGDGVDGGVGVWSLVDGDEYVVQPFS
jgi:hypothetical protein